MFAWARESKKQALRVEATYFIMNALVGGSIEHIDFLLNMGALDILTNNMDFEKPKFRLNVLQALDTVFQYNQKSANPQMLINYFCQDIGGIQKLEETARQGNIQVADAGQHILDTYFGTMHMEADAVIENTGFQNPGKNMFDI